jgi:hypothetical protein
LLREAFRALRFVLGFGKTRARRCLGEHHVGFRGIDRGLRRFQIGFGFVFGDRVGAGIDLDQQIAALQILVVGEMDVQNFARNLRAQADDIAIDKRVVSRLAASAQEPVGDADDRNQAYGGAKNQKALTAFIDDDRFDRFVRWRIRHSVASLLRRRVWHPLRTARKPASSRGERGISDDEQGF